MKTCATVAGILLLHAAALAQDEAKKKTQDLTELSLEELSQIKIDEVQGASRYVQKIKDAPASVSVLTSDDIRKFGYRTLAEALRSIRGLYVTCDRNYTYLGVRGFGLPADYNSRILVLVDGHRLNDSVYGSPLIAHEFILDPDLIERVEFIRGPSSSLYGSNAFLGVVNVTTRKARSIDGAEVSASAGSFDSYKGRASFGKTLKGNVDVLLSASVYDSRGQDLYYPEFDDPATNNGRVKRGDGESYYSLLGQVSVKGVTIQGAYISREKTVPTAPYGSFFPSRDTVTWDDRGWLDVKYERAFDGGLDLLARLFYDGYWYHGEYDNEDATVDPPVRYINQDFSSSHWWGGEIKLTQTWFESRLKATLGGEFRDNLLETQENYDETVPRYTYLDSREDSSLAAVFAQADAAIVEGLRLTLGARYDRYSTFGGYFSPRAALIGNPFESTTLKALAGRAFRAPDAYELYYSSEYGQKPNPDLDPETIDTLELVLEQELMKGLTLTASGFRYQCRDMIRPRVDPLDGLILFDNVDKVKASGAEVEIEARLEDGFLGRLSYSYQKAEDDETGKWLANSPKHLVKLGATAPLLPQQLFLSLELQYVGERESIRGNTIDDYVLANLTVFTREIVKGLELSASVYNLFDKQYYDPGGLEHAMDQIEQDGTTFRVKLTYRF